MLSVLRTFTGLKCNDANSSNRAVVGFEIHLLRQSPAGNAGRGGTGPARALARVVMAAKASPCVVLIETLA